MGACDGCGTPEDVRKDNHIHVELDFVPVAERLPVEPGLYPTLSYGCWHRDVRWSGERWETVLPVTHWSEIPTIEERG